jgi:hypothetical protein
MSTPLFRKTLKKWRGQTYEEWCYCIRETKPIPLRVVALECGRYMSSLGWHGICEPPIENG